MKKFLRSCVLLAAALVLLPVFLLLGAFVLPSQYGQTFLGEMPEKMRLLETVPGKRIVIIGGSSVPFALDSVLLEEQLPEYGMVDFGMYADMGTVVMLDWAKSCIHSGDLFIIAPEQNAQALSCYVGGEDVWQASDGAFRQLGLLPSRRWETLAAALPAFAEKNWDISSPEPRNPRGCTPSPPSIHTGTLITLTESTIFSPWGMIQTIRSPFPRM